MIWSARKKVNEQLLDLFELQSVNGWRILISMRSIGLHYGQASKGYANSVVSYKTISVNTASEMTYIVSGGVLNSTHSLTANTAKVNL